MSRVRVLYLGNLKSNQTEELIHQSFCERYGDDEVEKVRKQATFAFVHFRTRAGAVRALGEMTDELVGGLPLGNIALAKPLMRDRWRNGSGNNDYRSETTAPSSIAENSSARTSSSPLTSDADRLEDVEDVATSALPTEHRRDAGAHTVEAAYEENTYDDECAEEVVAATSEPGTATQPKASFSPRSHLNVHASSYYPQHVHSATQRDSPIAVSAEASQPAWYYQPVYMAAPPPPAAGDVVNNAAYSPYARTVEHAPRAPRNGGHEAGGAPAVQLLPYYAMRPPHELATVGAQGFTSRPVVLDEGASSTSSLGADGYSGYTTDTMESLAEYPIDQRQSLPYMAPQYVAVQQQQTIADGYAPPPPPPTQPPHYSWPPQQSQPAYWYSHQTPPGGYVPPQALYAPTPPSAPAAYPTAAYAPLEMVYGAEHPDVAGDRQAPTRSAYPYYRVPKTHAYWGPETEANGAVFGAAGSRLAAHHPMYFN